LFSFVKGYLPDLINFLIFNSVFRLMIKSPLLKPL
jgi:hypothetical protein